ncbi:MAG: hypothetical protein IMY75_08655, partial [Chloroflexi bacterium]|nr:hypothetical protein [Chloroflexota bacterium]
QQPGTAFGAQRGVRQDLDGYVTVEQGVVGAIDNTYTTPAEFGVEAVAVLECRSDHAPTSNELSAAGRDLAIQAEQGE